MKKEFTTYITPIETIFVLETATGGASSTAGGATLSQPLGTVQTRTTDEEADKVPQKPRQGPLRQQTGGGKHRDKRKEQKQGQEKHRKPFMENEIESTTLENDWKHGRRYHQVYGDPGENTKDEIYLVKKHYFKVPFDKKDSAKQIGLRWDPDVKTWYLPEYSVAGKRFESRLMAAKSVFGDEIKVASEEGVAEGSLDPDHEISMASNQLLSIIEDAMRLLKIVRKYSEAKGLEAWQQSKLTKAADYLEAVLNNLQGDQVFQKEDHSNYGNGWGQESYNTYAGSNHGRGVAEASLASRYADDPTHPSFRSNASAKKDPADSLQGILALRKTDPFRAFRALQDYGFRNPNDPIIDGASNAGSAVEKEMLQKMGITDPRPWDVPEEVIQAMHDAMFNYIEKNLPKQQGVAEGDFDKWGGEIKTPNPDRKQFKQPTSPAKLARQQAADRQRKKSAKESEIAEEELGRLKDRYSKSVKKEDSYTENLHNQLENFLKEKAPEGAKYKRMAKHIKASYKGSGLDKDEIAQRAFGATWKAAKKAKK